MSNDYSHAIETYREVQRLQVQKRQQQSYNGITSVNSRQLGSSFPR